jgi:tRNA-dihydrouridine synthase A
LFAMVIAFIYRGNTLAAAFSNFRSATAKARRCYSVQHQLYLTPSLQPVPSRRQHTRLQQYSGNQVDTSSTTSHHDEFNKHYQDLMRASRLSLAPMMDYTDRHFRHLVRLVSRETLVYSEMVAANALSHERMDRMRDYMESRSTNMATAKGETAINGVYDKAVMDATDPASQARFSYNPDYIVHRFLGQSAVPSSSTLSSSASSLAPQTGLTNQPSVLQLGGSDPQQLHDATQICMDLIDRKTSLSCDYTAFNLNCGCPSPKVAGKGCFGAALMEDPQRVASLVQAMHDGCQGRRPITVKCRIGTDSLQKQEMAAASAPLVWTSAQYVPKATIDDPDETDYRILSRFIETVASTGVVTDFSIHARIAVLTRSFSPADNRKIPPLKYHLVSRLTRDFPQLTFSLNGGVQTLPHVQEELEREPNLLGVMVGRGFVADPWGFAMADRLLYKSRNVESEHDISAINGNVNGHSSHGGTDDHELSCRNRLEVLEKYGEHADMEEAMHGATQVRRFLVKAVTPLFNGEPNAKRFRIALDQIAAQVKQNKGDTASSQSMPVSRLIMDAAQQHLSEETLLRTPEESYQRILAERAKGGLTSSVVEWQADRDEERSRTTSIAESG